MATIVIANDSSPARARIRRIAEWNPDNRVVAETGGGLEAFHEIDAFEPEVLLVSIGYPLSRGMDVLQRVHHLNPRTKIVAICRIADGTNVMECFQSGASAVIAEHHDESELLTAIHKVEAGHRYTGTSVTHALLDYVLKLRGRDARARQLAFMRHSSIYSKRRFYHRSSFTRQKDSYRYMRN